ncbi:unnamed protein product (macronuclear) [Paramecium tetraurelia]|uniref:Transmembrane protein n=1 Tax=Paramecium tetraurelia TaxID=5888 RepID=A0DAZ2_PARTE|nr:uncharacterized protein GSPATT00015116001 [Paramecium tetraurelia]CAK80209.1 unnamed protein product [Paramecium tetraurelia]|eukprot:XP_001447606.1 hypothetical protein (macronuclear) [Paramecium tetraurelia strain d4-2]
MLIIYLRNFFNSSNKGNNSQNNLQIINLPSLIILVLIIIFLQKKISIHIFTQKKYHFLEQVVSSFFFLNNFIKIYICLQLKSVFNNFIQVQYYSLTQLLTQLLKNIFVNVLEFQRFILFQCIIQLDEIMKFQSEKNTFKISIRAYRMKISFYQPQR